jgi:septum formation protein
MPRAAIVLASASPRRRELLLAAGLDFEQRPVEVDEALERFDDPVRAALELAERKARAVASAARDAGWILAADTIVALPGDPRSGDPRPPSGDPRGGWRLLGKPADTGEARAMLASLSGTRHAVVTGVCALRLADGALVRGSERTWVRMRPIAPAELEAYARSGEGLGKAGGYAIQETADAFVTELAGGGFDNVVGLPVALALRLLAELGAPLGRARGALPGLVRPPGPG